MNSTTLLPRLLLLSLLSLHLPPSHAPAQTTLDPSQLSLKIEALRRLKGLDLEANPPLKTAVLKVLEATRGTPQFVDLVKDFNLPGQEQGLLDVALQYPAQDAGVQAIRLILDQGNTRLIQAAANSTNHTTATHTITVLGNSGAQAAVPLILPLIQTTNSPLPLRRQAVQALSKTPGGATAILDLVEQDTLANDLRLTATFELNRVRWPELKSRATQLLPPLEGPDATPLPPISELVERRGDAANGLKVFQSATASCATCHKAGLIGVDVGPDLSLIGAKLGKDALFEAILDPSAGISFGFEAWSIELDDGEEAYGIIASETPDEVAIKATSGIITKYATRRIRDRTQMQLSLMPTGLQQAMPLQELIDLVEFLAALK